MKDLRTFLITVIILLLGVALITFLIMIGIFMRNTEQIYKWNQLYMDWNGSRYVFTLWGYISIAIFGGLTIIAIYLSHILQRRIVAYVLIVIPGIFLAKLIYAFNLIVISNSYL